MDIEDVAVKNPEKIITTRVEYADDINQDDIEKILTPFALNNLQKKEGYKLVKSIYKTLIEKDASLIEINPLIITKSKKIICLDAKINFDENALFRRPEILKLRDLDEEDPKVEASKYDLAYN